MLLRKFSLVISTFVNTEIVLAAASSQSLPWDSPIKTFQNSLTGPLGMGISVIGISVAGATLLFGGEISDFARKAVNAAMAISFILGASSFVSTLFASGATL